MMFTDEPRVEDFDSFQRRHLTRYSEFAERMLNEGVLLRSNELWYLSAVHKESEVEETLSAANRVLETMTGRIDENERNK